MTKSLLPFADEEDTEVVDLKINQKFAEKYAEKKKKEELSILEDKYKEKLAAKGAKLKPKNQDAEDEDDYDEEEEDSESDEEEDEDGELVTPAIDAQLLKTLADIRAKDSKIYDAKKAFFSPEELEEAGKAWSEKVKNFKKEKPMKLKDYHRERLLTGADRLDDDEDEEREASIPIKSHEEEQAEILKEFQMAAAQDDHDAEGEDDLLKVRPKGAEELAREEEEYKNFLLENLATSENARESMNEWFSRGGKAGASIDNDDQFLIEYILNRGWIEKDRKTLPVAMEEEEEDAEAVEKAEEFEEKYNFRFEQPGGTEIVTYARNIEGSLRQTNTSRKEQREARKARKAEEKARQQEELKRLKNLKKQEIRSKLAKIAEISGNQRIVEGDEIDLESDFDEEAHDKRMRQLFDDSYYDGQDDGSKPVWTDDEDDFDLPEEVTSKVIKKATKAVKKITSKATEDNEVDDKKKTKLSKLLDEYYEMDYEDMIGGDLPCRFKYQKVAPTTFGLNMDDILRADDTELNEYVSLKKLAPYRPVEVIQHDEAKIKSNKKKIYKFYDLLRRREMGSGLNDGKETDGSQASDPKRKKSKAK